MSALTTRCIEYYFCAQLQRIPEGDTNSLRSQDNSSVNTVLSNGSHSLSSNNCESLCISADDLLEQAKTHEEAGDLHVSYSRNIPPQFRSHYHNSGRGIFSGIASCETKSNQRGLIEIISQYWD